MRKQQLLNKSLAELKIYARKIGVSQPTSTKKEALVDKIIAVENGLVEPKQTNKGRKPYPSNFLIESNGRQLTFKELDKLNETFEKFKEKINTEFENLKKEINDIFVKDN